MNKQRRRANRKSAQATGPHAARNKRETVRRLFTEQLEDRRLLTGGANPYHNFIITNDVNGDFYVTPRDALAVIGELNSTGSRDLLADGTTTPAENRVDTDGDGYLSPRDALNVIDTLNGGEGDANGKVVALTLELQDANGNPLPGNRVMSGEDFRLQIYVQDLRTLAHDGIQGTGVYAAYMDIGYSTQLDMNGTLVDLVPNYVSGPDELTELFTLGVTDPSAFQSPSAFASFWVKSDEYENGNPYANPWRWFDTGSGTFEHADSELIEDEFDEMGAFLGGLTDDPGFGNNPIPMMFGTLTANLQYEHTGFVTFAGDMADRTVVSDIVFANDPNGDKVPFDAILFNEVTIEIYKPLYVRDVDASTAEDTAVLITPDAELDAGSAGTLTLQSFTQPTHGTVTQVGNQLRYTPAQDYNNDSGVPDTFTYTMTDGLGHVDTGTASVTVTAVNDPPIANPDSANVLEDSGATLISVLTNDLPARATAVDEQSQALSLVSAGPSAQGAVVSVVGDTVSYTPPADFFGIDTFTYTMQDELGATDTATVTVTVQNTNDAPVAMDDSYGFSSPLVLEDLAGAPFVELDVLNNDTTGVDPASEKATFTLIGVGEQLNGTNDAIVNPGVTANGGVVSISGGVVRYTPAADFFGTDTFVYEMSDRSDGSGIHDFATVFVFVTSVNDPPTAADAFLEAEEREAGDPPTELDVITGLTTPGPANEAALEGDEVFVNQILTMPAHGTLSILPGSKLLSYTPDVAFEGTDTFTYTVRDSQGLVSNVATATVVVEPLTLPRARDDRNVAVQEDTPALIDVMANDVLNPGANLSEFIVVQGASHGTAEVFDDAGVLKIRYTPDADYFGPDSFVYQIDDDATDSLPDTATVTVNVAPVNDPPVPEDDAYSFNEDETQLLSVLNNDTTGAANEIQTLAVNGIVVQPQFGQLSIVNNGTQLQYIPNADFYGTDTFTYTIVDSGGAVSVGAATVNLTVNNVNDPPTASDKAYTVDEDSSANPLAVTLGDVPGHVGLYSDDDGDAFTLVSAGYSNGTFQEGLTKKGGTVTIVGDIVQYTPAPNYYSAFYGTDEFTYVIEDNFGARDSATITITVNEVNDPPTVHDELLLALKNFSDQELDVLANDSITPDEGTGEVLTIKELVGQDASGVLVTPHGSARVSADGLLVIYTPLPGFETVGNDYDSFEYVVQDGRGGETTGLAQVEVIDAVPTDISGSAYIDANGDGVQHSSELTLAGVDVRLTGMNIRGDWVDITVQTDSHGVFRFEGILPSGDLSGYSITAATPRYLDDGQDAIVNTFADDDYDPGVAHNDVFTGIDLGVWGANGRAEQNYSFGESGLKSQYIKLSQYLASTQHGLMLATDGMGDTFWYSVVDGWEGVESIQFAFSSIPPAGSTNTSGLATATLTVNGQSRQINYYTHFDFAGDPRSGGCVVFLKGTLADMGFVADAEGEGEQFIESEQLELLAARGGAQYRAGVDVVFGSDDWV